MSRCGVNEVEHANLVVRSEWALRRLAESGAVRGDSGFHCGGHEAVVAHVSHLDSCGFYLVTDGHPVSGISDPVRFIGIADIPLPFGGEFAVIPVSAILLLVCYFGVAIFLQRVSLGRHIFAVGGNPQAAQVSGINVDGVLVFVYATSGFFAGLAALLMAGRTGSGYPNLGIGAELDAIAAVIIGGASFFGGRGTVLGVFAGVLVMGLLRNGLNLMDISAFWQQTLIGIVILLAVWIDVLRRRSGRRT